MESPSDYHSLGKHIEERLKALLAQQQTRTSIPSITSAKQVSSEFQPFELACLACIGMESSGATVDSWVSVYIIKNEMEALGFNNLAVNVALLNLSAGGYVGTKELFDDHSQEPYAACQLSFLGWEWVAKNIATLNLKAKPKKSKGGFNKPLDDEIPF